MRRIFLLFTFFVFLCSNLFGQVDTTFYAIKENTEKTAQHTEKGSYEYVSISVSLLAFIIAGITLYFSIRTFRSQRRTEKNTLRWSAKQERANLRRIAWNLLMSYRKLLTIEKILLGMKKFPLPENFVNMKIQIEDIHLNEFFGNDIDYDGLYTLGEEIRDYNLLMDNRCSQAKANKIPRDLRTYVHEPPKFFYEERLAIRDLLYMIDDIYPQIFDSSEKKWCNRKEAEDIIKVKPLLFDSTDNKSSYSGTFYLTPLDSIKGVLKTEYADMYFSIPFIEYVNRIHSSHFTPISNPSFEMELFEIMENMADNNPSYILDSSLSPDILSILKFNGLKDPDHAYCHERKKKFDRLPLIKDYIGVVLYLIEIDSKKYAVDGIEDIYVFESDCEKSVLMSE